MAHNSLRGLTWLANLRTSLDALESQMSGISSVHSGVHICTLAEKNAGIVLIDSGILAALGFMVQVIRDGKTVVQACTCSMSSGIVALENAPPFSVKENDVVTWMVF
jgi:hypothetical protein